MHLQERKRWLKHMSDLVVEWYHRLFRNVLPVFVCNFEKLLRGASELTGLEFLVCEVSWMGNIDREEGKSEKEKLNKGEKKRTKESERTKKNSLGEHCYWIVQITPHIVHCVVSHKSVMWTTEPISLQLCQDPAQLACLSVHFPQSSAVTSCAVRIIQLMYHLLMSMKFLFWKSCWNYVLHEFDC